MKKHERHENNHIKQNIMADTVVLLHGILRSRRCMGKLARLLAREGFHVLNTGYASSRYDIAALAQQLHTRINEQVAETQGKVHFVGFSMGGLLIRAYLAAHRPKQLGRVVMLGTPNNGSEVADFLQHNPLYRWVYGPAGQQLITRQQAFIHHFGAVDYELGIIAGNKPVDGFLSSRLIPSAHDGRVSVESTKLHGMKDHIILPVNHTFLPAYAPAMQQTLKFLQHGQFTHSSPA